jgi:hypothetical protein
MSDSSGAPTRPSGWYADPEQRGELRYWDGNAWGAQFKSSARTPGEHPRLGRGFAVLAATLGSLLVLALLVLVAQLVLYTWAYVSVDDAVASGDLHMLTTFDDLDRVTSVSLVGTILVAGVCWMVWQHRVARAVPGLERSPAMHAFSWIIPIGALWLPFQNVRDLWRRCVRGRGTAMLGWWWTGWLVAGLLGRVTSSVAESADTVSGLRGALAVGAAAALIGVLTAGGAVRIVRAVSAGAASGNFVDVERPPINPVGLRDRW